MDCPACLERQSGYVTFRCGHSVCNQCVLKSLNRKIETCPLCRGPIMDSIPREILDEVQVIEDNGGYESTDEIDPDATHVKIKIGFREIAIVPNDAKRRDVFYEDETVKIRVEARGRKYYLVRADDPTPMPIHPLRRLCALNRPLVFGS